MTWGLHVREVLTESFLRELLPDCPGNHELQTLSQTLLLRIGKFSSMRHSFYCSHTLIAICPMNYLLIWLFVIAIGASPVAQLVKNPPAMQETWVQSLGWEGPNRARRPVITLLQTVNTLVSLCSVDCQFDCQIDLTALNLNNGWEIFVASHRLSCPVASGILVPQSGTEPMSPAF